MSQTRARSRRPCPETVGISGHLEYRGEHKQARHGQDAESERRKRNSIGAVDRDQKNHLIQPVASPERLRHTTISSAIITQIVD